LTLSGNATVAGNSSIERYRHAENFFRPGARHECPGFSCRNTAQSGEDAGNEMSCFPFDSGKDDRSILIGQRNSLREVARRCIEELNASAQSRQPAALNVIGQLKRNEA
jgi:hypothetical protein